MSTQSLSQGDLLRMVITRFVGGAVVLGAIFFGTAGTFAYWHAWLFLAVVFLPMLGALAYLIRRDPALLERRMRTRERETQQQWIIGSRLCLPMWRPVWTIASAGRMCRCGLCGPPR
jgi:hypothetical protein